MSLRARVAPAPPAFTVAEVLRVGLPDYAREHRLPPHHWRALRAIMACRTPELGGHWYQCSQCGERQFVPHSCRNRHCPTCQGAKGYAWMQAQAEALLPVPYFHLVFTLPHALNPVIRQNQARCYDLLFFCAARTLLEFGRSELQAQLGLTTVLHTWSQTLEGHYHLHCIVTGGGLREDGSWAGRPPHWLFPVRALSAMFRGKFRAGLQQLYQDGQLEFHGQLQPLAAPAAFGQLVRQATRKPWNVYAKRPFAGPAVVLANRNRHTRIAAARAALPPAPEPAAPLAAAGEPEVIPAPEAPVGLPRCCPHCHQRADWVLVERVAPQHPRPRGIVPYLDSS